MDLGVSLRKINNIFNTTTFRQNGSLSLWFLSRFFFIMHFSDRPETIPIVFRIWLLHVKSIYSRKFSQIRNSMHRGDGFSATTLGKGLFHFQNDWCGNGPAWSVLVGKTPWVYVNFVCESKKENINPIQTGSAAVFESQPWLKWWIRWTDSSGYTIYT